MSACARVACADLALLLCVTLCRWMFLSLHRLLVYLDARKQAVKLHIYRQLTVVLTASLILGVMYAAYQIYFTINQQQMIKWANLWLLDQGIPFMIYTLILLSIAALWRPSAEGKQYQYSQLQVGDSEDADDEFGAEKNERGEAGDSEDEDEEDAGLDVDLDQDSDHHTETAEKEAPAKPPQKMRAQFSIGGEDSEEVSKPKATAPLLAAPDETAGKEVTGVEAGGKEAGGAGSEVKVVVSQPMAVDTEVDTAQAKVKKATKAAKK